MYISGLICNLPCIPNHSSAIFMLFLAMHLLSSSEWRVAHNNTVNCAVQISGRKVLTEILLYFLLLV